MNEIDEEIFEDFLETIDGKDYSGGQLPMCAKYAFKLFCHQKRQEIQGPPKRDLIEFV